MNSVGFHLLPVLEESLGAPLGELFEELDPDPVAAASVPVRREGQVGYDGQMRRSRAFKLGDQTHDLVFQPRFVLRIEEGDDARLVHGVATHQTEEDLSAALDRDGLKA